MAPGVPGEVEHLVVPGGRELVPGPARDPGLLSRRLAAALLPFADRYPMPFFRVEGGNAER